ncbi:carcinoembryonic antigen-related cell adhesion molecule 5-like [Narcine bancroftii]|uniref:carcinoembryonic antigen-related cell adhesion molecule 5-like n=1 Tax=Narcine bancroftii TaxID=1343680 RepID=UPI003831951C
MPTHGFLLLLCLAAVRTEPADVEGKRESIEAAVGALIMLEAGVLPEARSGTWRFQCSDIGVWIGNIMDINNDYTDRAELLGNRSLMLQSLTVNDTGEYAVTLNPLLSNSSITVRVYLTVLVPVSKPTVIASVSEIAEGNGTVTLSCELSGDSPTVQWIKDGEWLQYHERMNISSDNQTLTISAVNRSDRGDYQCMAHNPVSTERSDKLLLTVFNGPEEMVLTMDPMQEDIIVGINVTFNCSVQSVPPSEFEWFFNADMLDWRGPKLDLVDVGRNNSGNYTCQARNNMTGNFVTSSKTMKVIELVSKPIITTNVLHPVEHNDTLTLTCAVTGDVVRVNWILPVAVVSNNELMQESADNMTLTVLSVDRSYSGDYRCQVWGIVNNETSDPFAVEVSYGPDAVKITTEDNKEIYALQSNLSLSCTADSVPPAEFQWLLNGKSLEHKSQSLVIVNMTENDFGNYTCRAYNNRTKQYVASAKLITTNGISVLKISSSSREPIEHGNVTLTCDVSGQFLSIQWNKDNQALEASRNAVLSEGNKTLTIREVDRIDAGNYSCVAEGLLGRKASQLFQLAVFYGPDDPQISTGQRDPAFLTGSNVTLTCEVLSFPASEVRWYLNGKLLPHHKEELIIFNLGQNNTGNYTCETFNSKTQLIKQKSVQISLLETSDLEDYGNKSWIAAAVVGVLVIIAISACAFFRNRN